MSSDGAPPGDSPPVPLPPPTTPPGPPPQAQPGGRRNFLIGLAVGAIPLVIAMVGLGAGFNASGGSANFWTVLLPIGGILYVLSFVVSIALTINSAAHRFGLGMLIAVLVSPVVFFVGCLVVLTHPIP